MTQLYAMLEQDQDTSTAGSAQTPATWDLPRYFNKLISRSCVSLCDSHQVNVTSATINQNSGGGKCSTASGWGSASCLNCRNTIHKRLNGKGCVGIKMNQSSLVTLLNLAVDSGGYETIYQLVDRSLLVDPLLTDQILLAVRNRTMVQSVKKSSCHSNGEFLFQGHNGRRQCVNPINAYTVRKPSRTNKK